MRDPLAKQHSQNVRLTLSRRLRDFYSTLTGYFAKDASAVLQQVEERATPRERDNDWHRVGRP